MGRPILLTERAREQVAAFAKALWEAIPPDMEEEARRAAFEEFLNTVLTNGTFLYAIKTKALSQGWQGCIGGLYWYFLSAQGATDTSLKQFQAQFFNQFQFEYHTRIHKAILQGSRVFIEGRCSTSSRIIALVQRYYKARPLLNSVIPEVMIIATVRFLQANGHLLPLKSASVTAVAILYMLYMNEVRAIGKPVDPRTLANFSKWGETHLRTIRSRSKQIENIIQDTNQPLEQYLMEAERSEYQVLRERQTQELLKKRKRKENSKRKSR